jgi:hypothetical protein
MKGDGFMKTKPVLHVLLVGFLLFSAAGVPRNYQGSRSMGEEAGYEG